MIQRICPTDAWIRHLAIVTVITAAQLAHSQTQAPDAASDIFGEATAGMAGYTRIIKLSKDNSLILTDALPRFPGQKETTSRVKPNIEVPASDSFNIAMASLTENGKQPENPFIRRDESRFPLVQAILDRDTEAAMRLIEAGSPLDIEASREALGRWIPSQFEVRWDGVTPKVGYPLAIAAAVRGLPQVLKAIGQRDPALLKLTDSDGRTALAYAARLNYQETTRYLLEQGLSPLHPAKIDPISNTPLVQAAFYGHTEVVALLMQAIPREQLGHTAVLESVWFAAGRNNLATVKVLLEGGASPNYVAPQGGTPLMDAVRYGKLEMVRLLLNHGATVDDHLYRGYTITQFAEIGAAKGSANQQEILELIRHAPRKESGWKKSKEVEDFERMLRMIEHPEEFKK